MKSFFQKKNFFFPIISIALSLALATSISYASTTISTDINTEGTLTVTGISNLKDKIYNSFGALMLDQAGQTNTNIVLNPTGGNVGIGTTTPYAKLSAQGLIAGQYFNADSTTGTSTFGGNISVGAGNIFSTGYINILRGPSNSSATNLIGFGRADGNVHGTLGPDGSANSNSVTLGADGTTNLSLRTNGVKRLTVLGNGGITMDGTGNGIIATSTTNGDQFGGFFIKANLNNNSNNQYFNLITQGYSQAGQTTMPNQVAGIGTAFYHYNPFTIPYITGIESGGMFVDGAGAIVTKSSGIMIGMPTVTNGGHVGTGIGIEIHNMGTEGIDNTYAIYSDGPYDTVFRGPMTIGTITRGKAALIVQATTSTASPDILRLNDAGGVEQMSVDYTGHIRKSDNSALTLNVDGFVNVDQYSGYKQAGNKILYASSTNQSIAVGQYAGVALLADGSYNTAIGYDALKTATSTDANTAVGWGALSSSIEGGTSDTAVGFKALNANTTGGSNQAFGYKAMMFNTTGGYNTAVGNAALYGNISGSYNVALGHNALVYATAGSQNTAIGTFAGMGDSAYNNNYNSTVDTNMTFVGYGASRNNNTASTSAMTNSTAIGYNAKVGCSNCLVLGNGVNVGIGTTTPTANFQVTTSTANATTSVQFGKANQNKGTCRTEYDTAGSPVYIYIAAGATAYTFQNGGTPPSGCQN